MFTANFIYDLLKTKVISVDKKHSGRKNNDY